MTDRVAFATPGDFRDWLAQHHAISPEIWMLLHKSHTGTRSITWDEAVQEALCWGWIDGIKKSLGPDAWTQRFTPRRPRSIWSKRNRDLAESLIAAGRMQVPGLAQVTAARADGRWDAAYAGSAQMEIPADFLAALAAAPQKAQDTYASLNRRNLYAIYHSLTTAKRPETRARRMDRILQTLIRGERFH